MCVPVCQYNPWSPFWTRKQIVAGGQEKGRILLSCVGQMRNPRDNSLSCNYCLLYYYYYYLPIDKRRRKSGSRREFQEDELCRGTEGGYDGSWEVYPDCRTTVLEPIDLSVTSNSFVCFINGTCEPSQREREGPASVLGLPCLWTMLGI